MNTMAAADNPVGVDEVVPPGLRHLQTLSGHRNVVYECAWSPRGRVLVSVAADRTICRWDLQKGKPVQSSQEFYDFLFGVAWSPNGRYLATGSFDKTVRIIYAGSGKQAQALTGHKGPVFSVAWSRTSRYLASASDDKTVRLWDGDQRWKSQVLEGHEDWVLSVSWSFQEYLLASGSRDKTVRIWDAREKSPRFVLRGHTDIVNCVAWSPNGSYLASASDDKEVRIWNAQTQRQVIVLSSHKAPVLSVRFSPDGRLLATKSRDGTVQLWDCNRWKQVAVLEEAVKSDLCNGLAFHPNQHQLVTLSNDQKGLRIWQLDYTALLGEATKAQRLHPLICPECAELISASMVNHRLERGRDRLTCPVCDTVIPLLANGELNMALNSDELAPIEELTEEQARAVTNGIHAVAADSVSTVTSPENNETSEPASEWAAVVESMAEETADSEPTQEEQPEAETAVNPPEPATKRLIDIEEKTAVSPTETAV